ASAIKSGLPMPFTSISAGWIFTLMGLLDDGRPLNQGKSQYSNNKKTHAGRSVWHVQLPQAPCPGCQAMAVSPCYRKY
ncbi:hypothetical protein, partial [Thiolapillus sp.]